MAKKYFHSRTRALALLLASIIATLWTGIYFIDRSRTFDACLWREVADRPNLSVRYRMAHSLLANLQSSRDMTVHDVIALLGKPDMSNLSDLRHGGDGAGGYMAYKIGEKSIVFPSGGYFLFVTFDPRGIIASASIVPE